jgi:hypothetical protein
MKANWKTFIAAVSLTALSTTTASAQSSQYLPAVEPGPDNCYSSTVQEGYLSGLARVIRAMGQFNVNTAEARRLNEDAREHFIQNWVSGVSARFKRQQLNREHRLAQQGPQLSPSQLDEVMRNKAPDPLLPAELNRYTGAIRWPEALQYPWFDEQRRQMEPLFESWAAGQGGRGTHMHGQVVKLAGKMIDQLRANIHEMDAYEAIAARKFIDGLRYASQVSPQVPEVAQSLEATQYQLVGDSR